MMSEPKYITIPIGKVVGRMARPDGSTIPIFDQVTMLRADYDRIIANGGQEGLRRYLLDERPVDH